MENGLWKWLCSGDLEMERLRNRAVGKAVRNKRKLVTKQSIRYNIDDLTDHE